MRERDDQSQITPDSLPSVPNCSQRMQHFFKNNHRDIIELMTSPSKLTGKSDVSIKIDRDIIGFFNRKDRDIIEVPRASKDGTTETFYGLSPEIHGQDLALTVLHVPYSLTFAVG